MPKTYQDARGEVVYDETVPGVFTTKVKGYLSTAMADALIVELERLAKSRGALRVAHDWAEMSNYDGDARTHFTTFSLNHRKHLADTVVLVKSAMVSMGVNTAGLALRAAGMPLSSTTDRSVFDEKVRAMMLASKAA